MSDRDYAKELIDRVSDGKLFYVISFLQGAVAPDEIPNEETREAIAEVDEMIQVGAGEHFEGSTAEYFSMLTGK